MIALAAQSVLGLLLAGKPAATPLRCETIESGSKTWFTTCKAPGRTPFIDAYGDETSPVYYYRENGVWYANLEDWIWMGKPVFVDEIDGNSARVIIDGTVVVIPANSLPMNAREGTWLWGHNKPGDEAEKLRRALGRDDPGGDIKL